MHQTTDENTGARLDKDQVRRAYRPHAPTYDLWSRLAESRARQRCLELAPELERADFRDVRREYLSQLGFPSEILVGLKPEIMPM